VHSDRLVALQNSVTTNAPNPPHWTLNWRFGAFRTIFVHSWPFDCLTKLGAIQADVVQKFVPWICVGIFRNERIRSTPLHRKLTFCCVSYYLGAFRTFGCLTKLGAKWAELMQKFVPWNHVRIFWNERTQYTPLYPKVMFWDVSYYLCAFRTIWLPYESRCKTDRTSAKVRASKSRRNFSQRTHPINHIGP